MPVAMASFGSDGHCKSLDKPARNSSTIISREDSGIEESSGEESGGEESGLEESSGGESAMAIPRGL